MPTLGCSQHVVYIQGKCNGARLCELSNVTQLTYDRRLDDISQAMVEIAISGDSDDPCCACIGDVEPWCHVLTIVREGDGVVWTGPVQKVFYGYDSVKIEASDKLIWLTARINEIAIDQFAGPGSITPLTDIAETIAQVAMADDGDSPCFMECVLNLGDGLPVNADRSMIFPAFDGPTAYDDFTRVADAGIDFTVVNQCLILGPEALPAVAIGTLLDEHILGEISVIKDGSLLANRVYVRYEGDDDCENVCAPQHLPDPCTPPDYTECCPCPAVAEGEQECYGSVERLISNSLGIQTLDMATTTAQTFLNASRIVPRRIEFPTGTRLSPDTPWGIQDMIPGQRIDVALSKLCFPVFQSFKLQQVSVEDSADGEQISIDLTALTTS
jgi:hypothetical protein